MRCFGRLIAIRQLRFSLSHALIVKFLDQALTLWTGASSPWSRTLCVWFIMFEIKACGV
jgi:hypothetical protein